MVDGEGAQNVTVKGDTRFDIRLVRRSRSPVRCPDRETGNFVYRVERLPGNVSPCESCGPAARYVRMVASADRNQPRRAARRTLRGARGL